MKIKITIDTKNLAEQAKLVKILQNLKDKYGFSFDYKVEIEGFKGK